jgi:hypothetical protein
MACDVLEQLCSKDIVVGFISAVVCFFLCYEIVFWWLNLLCVDVFVFWAGSSFAPPSASHVSRQMKRLQHVHRLVSVHRVNMLEQDRPIESIHLALHIHVLSRTVECAHIGAAMPSAGVRFR